MRQLSLIFLSFCLLFEVTSGRKIAFTDCAAGEVHSVDVVPCDKEPCMFKKGTNVTMTAEGVSSKGAESGELSVTIELGGVEVPYPGIDPDICHKVKCPVVKGQHYSIQYEILVQDYFPAVSCLIICNWFD